MRINLLPSRHRAERLRSQGIRIVLAVTAAALVLLAGYYSWQYFQLRGTEARIAQLEAQLAALEDVRALEAEWMEKRNIVTRLGQQEAMLAAYGAPVELFNHVAAGAGNGLSIWHLRLSADGTLLIAGTASNPDRAAAYAQHVSEFPGLGAVQIMGIETINVERLREDGILSEIIEEVQVLLDYPYGFMLRVTVPWVESMADLGADDAGDDGEAEEVVDQ